MHAIKGLYSTSLDMNYLYSISALLIRNRATRRTIARSVFCIIAFVFECRAKIGLSLIRCWLLGAVALTATRYLIHSPCPCIHSLKLSIDSPYTALLTIRACKLFEYVLLFVSSCVLFVSSSGACTPSAVGLSHFLFVIECFACMTLCLHAFMHITSQKVGFLTAVIHTVAVVWRDMWGTHIDSNRAVSQYIRRTRGSSTKTCGTGATTSWAVGKTNLCTRR